MSGGPSSAPQFFLIEQTIFAAIWCLLNVSKQSKAWLKLNKYQQVHMFGAITNK